MRDIAIVYMVAGLSSRFGEEIKQFAKIGPNEESLIEYSLNQALKAGFTKIIFVVGEKAEKLFKEKFGNKYKGIPVYYAFQKYDTALRDKPWGTADALCSAKSLLNCPFVVCNGDDIYGEEAFKILIEHLKNKNTNAALAYRLGDVLSELGGVNRGIFELNPDKTVKSINETFNITIDNLSLMNLSKNSLCSMNLFALYPQILNSLEKLIIQFKIKHKNNKEKECLLPAEITNLIRKREIVMDLYPTNEKWFGVTRPGDEVKIREFLKLNEKKK